MPSLLAEDRSNGAITSPTGFPFPDKTRASIERPPPPPKDPPGALSNGDSLYKQGDTFSSNGSVGLLSNGRPIESSHHTSQKGNTKRNSDTSTSIPVPANGSNRQSQEMMGEARDERGGPRDDGRFAANENGDASTGIISRTTHVKLQAAVNGIETSQETEIVDSPTSIEHEREPPSLPVNRSASTYPSPSSTQDSTLRVPGSSQRLSSPAALANSHGQNLSTPSSLVPGHPANRLQQRHTLEVPRVSTASRLSREYSSGNVGDDVVSATGRFSPNTPTRRRGSMTLVRRATRSINSDVHLDEVPQDEEAARWAEHIRQKRASRRRKQEEEDDDRVVVGTKVDQNHVNWITAYNMLTGIRFTVSRTNAKMDRELTDADFDARHKFSFDITGNELTPSAKYDFKFKDYAPWVFRHLRQIFQRDPADYLMSLTSKYILSELTSPGKSGSFFYYSRDYRYIIKTIHHAEHKFLRRILKDYYNHVKDNPNTLLSQFYGLHRVKIPYGRKIHFVVMNNLFPPHRDIHTTFDLKGSTIGRDFREEDLEKNPRATLKDLNWLRRERHLEFGPTKKQVFIEQMEKDVRLLQRLKIMDYSMLIGIHDLQKGNQDNIRDKTLQVFQPGGEDAEDPVQPPNVLQRTPSKLETARKAKELRQIIKSQKPIPMDQTANRMPDEVEEVRKNFYFYSDDGGFRATHENNSPGEEIYYLGIIDCLTHYNVIKRTEHFFKGLTNPESQISAIPPERYGERFLHFISGITMTREAAERLKTEEASRPQHHSTSIDDPNRTRTDVVIEKAEKQAAKGSEENVPERSINTVRSPSAERGELGYTLPVVEEAAENISIGGRSARSGEGIAESHTGQRPPPTPPKDSGRGWGQDDNRPPTPPKDDSFRRNPGGPPTPPKDDKYRHMEELGMRVGPVH